MFGLFIGCGLIVFSFEIGGFDMLPDFIGYFLVFRCLDRLCYKSDSFRRAIPLALAMSCITLAVSVLPFFLQGSIADVFKRAAVVLSLAFFFLIVKGIEEIEKTDSTDLKSRKLKISWAIFTLSQLICTFMPVRADTLSKLIITLGAVGAVISSLAILVSLYMAKVAYEYGEAPEEEKAKRQKKPSYKKRKQAKK